MKISFIIPVYNNGVLLKSMVQNIEYMYLKDYEIILVNDGSQDDSKRICDELAQKNRNIYCLHQENQGVSAARNNGLKNSSGEYVLFLDADDTIESRKLCKLLKKLDHEPKIDMAIFGLSFDYYYNGILYRKEEFRPSLKGVQGINQWGDKILELYYDNSLSPIWNKIFSSRFLKENNLYLRNDMFLYEDLEYSLRCMAQCSNIFFEPSIIYHYRQSEDEGNAGRRLMKIEHIYSLVDQIEEAFNQIGVKSTVKTKRESKNILISLYLILAREKIAVSNVEQIKLICEDFADWYYQHRIEIPSERQAYAKLLLDRKIMQILLKRKYTKIRHRIAIKVKSVGIYQKLRG